MRGLQQLLQAVAPADCLACQTGVGLICPGCLPTAAVAKTSTCWRCNRQTKNFRTCASCRASTPLAAAAVASHYEGPVKRLVLALKYQHAAGAARPAATLLAPLLTASDYDVITWVPSAPARRRQRGYNPAQLIAAKVAEQLALPSSALLLRLGNHRQVGASRQARLRQLQQAFETHRRRFIRGNRVLIIDDVLTTGATLHECAKVLKAAGAKSIQAAVVAKH